LLNEAEVFSRHAGYGPACCTASDWTIPGQDQLPGCFSRQPCHGRWQTTTGRNSRLNRADIERLEALKDVLREMTGKENISDTAAMKEALEIAGHDSKSLFHRGCSEIL